MRPIKQGYPIVAAVDFEFKNPYTNRTIRVKKDSVFIVTNPVYDQKQHSAIMVDRKKTAKLNLGFWFSWDNLVQFFSVDKLPPSYYGD